jgi:hypothetical protein
MDELKRLKKKSIRENNKEIVKTAILTIEKRAYCEIG